MGEQPLSSRPKPTAINDRRASMVSLSYEIADAIQILVLVTRLVAPVQNADVALAVDDDRAGHSRNVVGLAHLAVLLVDVLQERHLLAARAAPAGPEVEHHHLALVLREADLRAGARIEAE